MRLNKREKEIEVAVMRTLAYQSIFEAIPSIKQLHSMLLIGHTCTKTDLRNVVKKSKTINLKRGYVFFETDEDLLQRAVKRHKWSLEKLDFARKYLKILSLFPWVRLIAVSGAVAAYNATEDDDIDIFIVTSKNRLWIARTLDWILLNFMRVRRNASSFNLNNKFCPNYYISEDKLALANKDVFTANEIARLIPIYDKGIYKHFINSNSWISEYMPNFWKSFQRQNPMIESRRNRFRYIPIDWVERLLEILEKRYMMTKKTKEYVNHKEIRFHPKDVRPKVLSEYKKILKRQNISSETS